MYKMPLWQINLALRAKGEKYLPFLQVQRLHMFCVLRGLGCDGATSPEELFRLPGDGSGVPEEDEPNEAEVLELLRQCREENEKLGRGGVK